MAVEASDKPNFPKSHDDEDDDGALTFRRYSSKKNQSHSEVKNTASHNHEGQSYRSNLPKSHDDENDDGAIAFKRYSSKKNQSHSEVNNTASHNQEGQSYRPNLPKGHDDEDDDGAFTFKRYSSKKNQSHSEVKKTASHIHEGQSYRPNLPKGHDDEDDDGALTFKRYSSKKNQWHSEVKKIASHNHEGQSQRQTADVPSSNGQTSGIQKDNIVPSSNAPSPMKPSVGISKASDSVVNTSSNKLPVANSKSPSLGGKPNPLLGEKMSIDVKEEEKPIINHPTKQYCEDSEDDDPSKPLSSMLIMNSNHNKKAAPVVVKKSSEDSDDDDDEDMSLSAKFNLGTSSRSHIDSDNKPTSKFQKERQNGSSASNKQERPSTLPVKRPPDNNNSLHSSVKKSKTSDSAASIKTKKVTVKREMEVEEEDDDDDDEVPFSRKFIKSVASADKSSSTKHVTVKREMKVEEEDDDDEVPIPRKFIKSVALADKSSSTKILTKVAPSADKSSSTKKTSTKVTPSADKSSSAKKTSAKATKVNKSGSPSFKKQAKGKGKAKSKKSGSGSEYSKSSKLLPSSGDGQKKWTTLVHNGVIFPPPYQPHGVKMLYKGKPVDLTPEQEEVATMYAVMRDTDYMQKDRFKENFWNDWRKVLGRNHVIQNLKDCEFTPIYDWYQTEKEKKKQMTTEEKKAQKEEKLKQEEERIRPTASVRKERTRGVPRGRGDAVEQHDAAAADADIEHDDHAAADIEHDDAPAAAQLDVPSSSDARVSTSHAPADVHADADEPEPADATAPDAPAPDRSSTFPYPGGPDDRRVLYAYGSHIARNIWDDLERPTEGGKQKLHNHAFDLDMHPAIKPYIARTNLLPLHDLGFATVNHFLGTAFVERWHGETNTFHLPVGEMTITLDDVSQLLHIPVIGDFYDMVDPTKIDAQDILVECLGCSYDEAFAELPERGCSVKFTWLKKVYNDAIAAERWLNAARCYLFVLLGRTLFCDKSGNKVKVALLYMVRDIELAGTYCWGAMALTHLYKQLTEATSPRTSQIAGFSTLFQAWIFEHFQGQIFGTKWLRDEYTEDEPRAKRWECKRTDGSLAGFRAALDHLRSEEVTWMPFVNPYHRPMDGTTFFKGHLRHGSSMVAYNADRVVRQFGWIQGIPKDPRPIGRAVVTREQADAAWMQLDMHLIPEGDAVVPGMPATVPQYFAWYRSVSHPYLKPENYPLLAAEFREVLPETLGLYDELEHGLESDGIPRGTCTWKIVERLKAIAKPFKRGLRSFSCASHVTDVSQPRPQ